MSVLYGFETNVRRPLRIPIGSMDAKFCPPKMNRLHNTGGANDASSPEQIRREVIKYVKSTTF